MLSIPDVLSRDEIQQIRDLIAKGRFVDGRQTASGAAAAVKNNLVLAIDSDEIDQIVVAALTRSPLFHEFVLPHRFAPLMVARYDEGMGYGPHVDSAIMGRAPQMRCDVSVTIFLTDPEDYEGGELVVESEIGEVSLKLGAGSIVVYPSGSLHRVEAIRSGRRQAIVTWAQSFIRDAEIRQMLFDLRRVLREVRETEGSADVANRLIKTYMNLYRRFAET